MFIIYAMFFAMSSDIFAHVLLITFAYHGFISTCAMILFTKPLRDKLFFCSRWNRTEQQILPPSDMFTSQAAI
uniref:G protein-coupled receptor n=1 Tax=Caenorhabditis tropicalis TaxID=1561998 RepID=A0A1I7TRG6_9PELO